ncbi:translesion error-prone DNA polymerase V autoproteolytic subunit [Halosquirtibacter laminarini]|uniref:Translesion error-prone DNA polymerase V autoproteolytic subunit n=1 Tax=Halosquirtibacter laminarini TaxID=3374600 RepID=A0AC61NH92_9BACT|nr:translesion error-prone DNA polymerase V autoproteolytic subunit [Prolixibacteraceae bacterium]
MNVKKEYTQPLEIFSPEIDQKMELPFLGDVVAGFPSPASDYMELKIDLNKELVQCPEATFYARVRGDSMMDAGLHDGDVLIIDRSLRLQNNQIAVCFVDGEFTVKRVLMEEKQYWLVPENPSFERIRITKENDFIVWGVVSYVIKKVL